MSLGKIPAGTLPADSGMTDILVWLNYDSMWHYMLNKIFLGGFKFVFWMLLEVLLQVYWFHSLNQTLNIAIYPQHPPGSAALLINQHPRPGTAAQRGFNHCPAQSGSSDNSHGPSFLSFCSYSFPPLHICNWWHSRHSYRQVQVVFILIRVRLGHNAICDAHLHGSSCF